MAPHPRLILTPSGSAWMTSTAAPVARRISEPRTAPEPFAPSSTRRDAGRPDALREREPVAPVVVDQVVADDDPPEAGVRRAAEVVRAPDQLLELVLDRIVELEAVAVEHLEPVVVGRVVRGRDHDPGREPAAPGKERERGRGHDPDLMDVGPEAGRPRPRPRPRTCRPSAACPGRRPATCQDPRGDARSLGRGRRPSVGFRSTFATPRMPSVPNRRAIDGSAGRGRGGRGQAGGRRRRWRRRGWCGHRHRDRGRVGRDERQTRREVDRHVHVRRARVEVADVEVRDEGRAVETVEVGLRPADDDRAPDRRAPRSAGRCRHRRGGSPTSKLRVDVTGRNVTVTSTVVGRDRRDAVGRVESDGHVHGGRRARDRDGLRVDRLERGQALGVALDGHGQRIDGDGRNLEPGCRVARDDGVDRRRTASSPVGKTRIFTRALSGSTFTGLTASPRRSMAVSGERLVDARDRRSG